MSAGDSVTYALEAARRRGERLAVATIVSGDLRGRRAAVWPGGQMLGDLGAPRLNQRVALYLESLLEGGGEARAKSFDAGGDRVVVDVEIVGS